MDINYYFDLAKYYIIENPIIALIALACIVLFAIKKPKEATKTGVFIAIVIAGLYVVSMLGDSSLQGVQGKKTGSMKAADALEKQ